MIKYFRYLIKNYLFGLLALVFTITYVISINSLPKETITFPRVILIFLVPLFIWNFAESVMNFRKTLQSEEPEEKKLDCSLHLTKARLFVMLVTLIYIFLMPTLGFVVTTPLYLAVLALFLGVRKPVRLIVFVVVFTAVVYVIFAMWLKVQIPQGLFI